MSVEQQIERLQSDFKKLVPLIKPEKMFGNLPLLAIVKELRQLVDLMETTDPCPKCNGTGGTEHDCGCEFCEVTIIECEYEKCFNGRVDKE